MTSPRTTRPIALSALALSVALLSGCVSAPGPTPSSTAAFASEEEAFAAAEETYRAYNEAGNSAERNAQDFLTGEALAADIETRRTLSAQGLTLEGTSEVISFKPLTADLEREVARVKAEVCIDVSDSRVVDSAGVDVTPSGRAEVWLLSVSFTGSSTSLLIEASDAIGEGRC